MPENLYHINDAFAEDSSEYTSSDSGYWIDGDDHEDVSVLTDSLASNSVSMDNMHYRIIDLSSFNQNRIPSVASSHSSKRRQQNQSSRTVEEIFFREYDFLRDNPKDMTLSRRLALYLSKSTTWYYPRKSKSSIHVLSEAPVAQSEHRKLDFSNDVDCDQLNTTMFGVDLHNENESGLILEELEKEEGDHDPPSLQKAWAYFEHVTLPRYIKDKVPRRDSSTSDIAEPRESSQKTKLYSPLTTSLKQMNDFSLDVRIYFSTISALAIILLLAGIINIPNIYYFSDSDYSNSQKGLNWFYKGSAICTQQEWVPCPGCNYSDLVDEERYRYASITMNDGDQRIFALKNQCDGATITTVSVSIATFLFLLFSFIIGSYYVRKVETTYKDNKRTVQNYSIVVTNPPADAFDPVEWKEYFEELVENARVRCCTVAIDNYKLVQILSKRREYLQEIKWSLPSGQSFKVHKLAEISKTLKSERNLLQRFIAILKPGIPELYQTVMKLTANVEKLMSKKYSVTKVFITFETEAAQKRVLSKLSKSGSNGKNKTLDASALFRNELALHVEQADEPSSIRWQDLDKSFLIRLTRIVFTTIVSFGLLALVGYVVYICRKFNLIFATCAIALSNAIFPNVAKLLTNMEGHSSEGSYQISLYLKITWFRWLNTAFIILIITPFTSYIMSGENSLLGAILSIIIAELVTVNALQLLDPLGNFRRHYVAPRAKRQDQMNLAMLGVDYDLAERYTNLTKVLFLSIICAPIFPGILFLASLILLINMYSDKFSIMRSWRQSPQKGHRISSLNRNILIPMIVAVMVIVASYTWTSFKFDNLCEQETDEKFVGEWSLHGKDVDVIKVNNDTKMYQYCDQRLFMKHFPAIPSYQPKDQKWMTSDQEKMTLIYGWTSVAATSLVALFLLIRFVSFVAKYILPVQKPQKRQINIPFSDLQNQQSYIPQIQNKTLPFPLFACSISNIVPELIGWKDPNHSYEYYDLTKDADVILCRKKEIVAHQVFSEVAYWPVQLDPSYSH